MPASINNNEEIINNNNNNNTIDNNTNNTTTNNTNNMTRSWSDDDIWYGDDIDFLFDSDFDADCNGFDGEFDDEFDEMNNNNSNNSNKTINYDGFYDEMNDLDTLYKSIHSPSQQSDVFNNVLLAILRPIFYLFCTLIFTLSITYIIANHYGYDVLQLISNIFSSSFFLHGYNENNINSIFFNNGSHKILLR
mmetsp:Transcript_71154/g.63876  ORF Transcript_71154/g.63876 Transcript_71154/m.63876 type:complete len:192 (-) Transcript_71154:84-659(-)